MTLLHRWVWAALLCCAGQAAQSAGHLSETSLGDGSKETILRQSIQMVAETAGPDAAAWGPEEAVRAIEEGRSVAIRLDGAPYRSDRPHWAVMRVRHDAAAADWVLYYRLATLERVQAYARHPGGPWVALKALHEQRGFLSGYHYPSFALAMQPHTAYELAVRVQTRAPIRMPVIVAPAYRFYEDQRSDLVQAGVAITVPVIVLLYLAVLLPRTVNVGLGWFMALIALETLGAMWVSGHGHVLWPFISREQWPVLGRLAYMAMVIVGWLHVERFVGMERLHRSLRIAAWLTIALILITGSLEILHLANTRDLFTYGVTLFPCLALGACINGHRRGVAYAGIYAMAWGAFVLAASISVLGLLGVAAITSWNVYYAQSSVAALLFGLVAVGHARERERLIAAERQRAQQLQQTLVMQQQFFAATNHDLHQPLNSLGIYLDLARSRLAQLPQPDARMTEFLSDAKAAYTGVAQFLDTLLDMARMEARLAETKPTRIAMGPLLDQLGREYRLLAGRVGLELRIVPTSAVVISDPHLLERMVRNLLANAVRYTQQGGILIAMRRRGPQWRLDIHDTGSGLSEQELTRLFAAFTALPKAQRDGSTGLGLGLFIVKTLAQSLGHRVEVRSRPGRGSRFSIWMRAADPASPSASSADA